jgi:predicted HTH domain antitoxin
VKRFFDSPLKRAYREVKGSFMQPLELDALVRAGIFASQEQGVQEAVRVLLTARPHLRVEAAIQLYREEQVTLGRAAEMAGLSRWEFRDLLADRGIIMEVETALAEEMDERFKELAARTGHASR